MIFRSFLLFALILHSLTSYSNSKNQAVHLSQDLIWRLHQGKNTIEIERGIEALEKDFFSQVKLGSEKQIFWINLYNAFMLLSVQKDTNVLHDEHFLSERKFIVAGRKISLNDIEYLYLNRGLKPNGKEKRFLRKYHREWMVDAVNKNVVYLLYRGYQESPPIVHLESGNFEAMITVLRWKFYEDQVKVARTECTVPSFIKELSPVYFSKDEIVAYIRENTMCTSQAVKYSGKKTPSTDHFYPKILP